MWLNLNISWLSRLSLSASSRQAGPSLFRQTRSSDLPACVVRTSNIWWLRYGSVPSPQNRAHDHLTKIFPAYLAIKVGMVCCRNWWLRPIRGYPVPSLPLCNRRYQVDRPTSTPSGPSQRLCIAATAQTDGHRHSRIKEAIRGSILPREQAASAGNAPTTREMTSVGFKLSHVGLQNTGFTITASRFISGPPELS